MKHIIFSLGSNLGDKTNYLKQALEEMQKDKIIEIDKISSIYETKALLPDNKSSIAWNQNFYNIVVSGYSDKKPIKILSDIKNIETKLGRKKRPKWSHREIDIDIISYENNSINISELVIPHKETINRDFVLIPILEILPNWQHPNYDNKQIHNISKKLKSCNIIKVIDNSILTQNKK